MKSAVVSSKEELGAQPGAFVVLGKNYGIDLEPNSWGLSVDSKIGLLAAGELYQPGTPILLSGGQKTAGPNYNSQPEAAKEYLLGRFPDIDPSDILLEENSPTTTDSAQNVPEVLEQNQINSFALVGPGHTGYIENASTLFGNYGTEPTILIAAEDIVAERSSRYQEAVLAWKGLKRIKKEKQKERIRSVLLRTIDRKGLVQKHLASRTRP